MKLIAIALLALMLAACGSPRTYDPPAPQAAAPVAAQPGYDSTVTEAQHILAGYGFSHEGTDYRGTQDCSAQACMGYFKGSIPNVIHVQLFVENDALQGIVVAAYGSPSDKQLQDLGYAGYDIMAGPLGASSRAVDCAIDLEIGETDSCDGIMMTTEFTPDGDGWMSVYRNTSR